MKKLQRIMGALVTSTVLMVGAIFVTVSSLHSYEVETHSALMKIREQLHFVHNPRMTNGDLVQHGFVIRSNGIYICCCPPPPEVPVLKSVWIDYLKKRSSIFVGEAIH